MGMKMLYIYLEQEMTAHEHEFLKNHPAVLLEGVHFM